MSPENFAEILSLSGASEANAEGVRELAARATLSLYLEHGGVGLTIAAVEAVTLRGHTLQARTQKGELYVCDLSDVFAASVDGRTESRAKHRPGFG
jgi:hypothetical protein